MRIQEKVKLFIRNSSELPLIIFDFVLTVGGTTFIVIGLLTDKRLTLALGVGVVCLWATATLSTIRDRVLTIDAREKVYFKALLEEIFKNREEIENNRMYMRTKRKDIN